MQSGLPDVQSERPDVTLEVGRVGLLRVHMPVASMLLGDRGYTLQSPVFSVFVNLPPDQRGIHASRSYETIYDVLSDAAWSKGRLEDVAGRIVEKLLERHEYSTRAEGRFTCKLFREVRAPLTGKVSFERIGVKAGAVGVKRGDGGISVSRTIGVSVLGITACPCAQRSIMSILQLGEEWERAPVATHMQRTLASVDLRFIDGESIDLLDLADVVKGSLSAPLYDLLKRPDEAFIVIRASKNTVLVEDAARTIATQVSRRFPSLNPETKIRVVVRSIESIHNNDFLAEFKYRIADVRRIYG